MKKRIKLWENNSSLGQTVTYKIEGDNTKHFVCSKYIWQAYEELLDSEVVKEDELGVWLSINLSGKFRGDKS